MPVPACHACARTHGGRHRSNPCAATQPKALDQLAGPKGGRTLSCANPLCTVRRRSGVRAGDDAEGAAVRADEVAGERIFGRGVRGAHEDLHTHGIAPGCTHTASRQGAGTCAPRSTPSQGPKGIAVPGRRRSNRAASTHAQPNHDCDAGPASSTDQRRRRHSTAMHACMATPRTHDGTAMDALPTLALVGAALAASFICATTASTEAVILSTAPMTLVWSPVAATMSELPAMRLLICATKRRGDASMRVR